MTRRDARVYLRHMQESAIKARSLVKGVSRSTFEADDRSVDAALRRLQVLGEAAR